MIYIVYEHKIKNFKEFLNFRILEAISRILETIISLKHYFCLFKWNDPV